MITERIPATCLAGRRRASLALCALAATVAIGTLMMSTASASSTQAGLAPVRLAAGLQGGAGSAIGPDGALYVTETAAGRISRIDPKTGVITPFASGLPIAFLGLGGAIDVAFIGDTAYALVTLVGPDVGGDAIVGIYRVDGPASSTVVADIGTFATATRPPGADVPSGLQYAMQPFRGGFLVTDGHHNRVFHATLDGRVREVIAFDNIVPTGLDVRGGWVFMAEAGPVPHLPEDGRIVAFRPWKTAVFRSGRPRVTEIASGARLLVDVEFGRGGTLYGLSQGEFPDDGIPASPALPNTGSLVRVNARAGFTVIAGDLNQPTSLEIVGNTAYIVTLGGEVWTVDLRRQHR